MSDDMPANADPGPAPPDPLFEPFERICQRLAGFAEHIDVCWVDGFLTALAAGPRHVPIDEWLPVVAGDAFERAFADPPDVAQATAALGAWYERLRAELDPEHLIDDPDRVHLAPLFDEWTEEDRERAREHGASAEDAAMLQPGTIWGGGFLAAIEAFPEDWREPPESDASPAAGEFRALLQTIECLALPEFDAHYQAFVAEQWKGQAPTRDELLNEVCFAVQDLRLYWLDHAPRPAPRHVAATPGRNDPCPCGSGRKYKKCHGAAA